ncbi:MAG TPA: hypothetical protein VL572_14005 [Pyrinomonadaceae bacterium]|nr:hypothetical protein [Pyrinomonadaceae bacterium]
MKAYLVVTGIVFLLLGVSHIARVVAEGTHLFAEPVFVLTTISSAGIFVWATALLRNELRGRS